MVVKAAGRTKLLRQLLPAEAETLYGNLEEAARVRTLGGIASMGIGAVTGGNDFFLLGDDDEPASDRALLRPAVSKSRTDSACSSS